MKSARISKLRTKFLYVILIAGGVMFGLVLLELGLRMLALTGDRVSTFGDTYVCSPTIGWFGRPNYQTFYVRDEFAHPIQLNSNGMYDTEHSLKKGDDTFRILLVGDSFTEALQVNETQTAHQLLENLLNEHLENDEKSFEVISTAVSGWGTGQQLLYYREQAHLYKPDLVVLLFFIGNDLTENLPGYALTIDNFNCFTPYFPVCNGQLDPQPWYYVPGLNPAWEQCSTAYKRLTAGLHQLRYYSYLVAALDPLLIPWKERRMFGNEYTLPYIALYVPEESEEERYAWQVTERLLTQFDQEVTESGTGFAVAYFGSREVAWLHQFDPAQLETLYQTDPHLRGAEPDRPNRRLMNFFQNQDIPALDLQPVIINKMNQTGTELYWTIDRHWTAKGNQVVAQALFDWLVSSGLVTNINDSTLQ